MRRRSLSLLPSPVAQPAPAAPRRRAPPPPRAPEFSVPPAGAPHVDLVRAVPAHRDAPNFSRGDAANFSRGDAAAIAPSADARALTIAPALDSREAAADRVAERVVPSRAASLAPAPPSLPPPAPPPPSTPPPSTPPPSAPPSAAPESIAAAPKISHALDQTRGTGSPLPSDLRSVFESSLGADLRGVRVHTGARAHELNRAFGSRAFTVGRDLYFKAGAFAPERGPGQRLIAHELAHTLRPTENFVQRAVDLAVSALGVIDAVKVTRDDTQGLFGASKGDHTSAHVSFRDMIVNNLTGVSLANAANVLLSLYQGIANLPGYALKTELDDTQRAIFEGAEADVLEAINELDSKKSKDTCIAAAEAIITFRNLLPLSAAEFGGTGGGEAGAHKFLNECEAALRASPLQIINLDNVQRAFVTLLDVKRLGADVDRPKVTPYMQKKYPDSVFESKESMALDKASMPGLTGHGPTDAGNVIAQHLGTMKAAYPRVWARLAAGGDPTKKLTAYLMEQLGAGLKDPAY